MITPFASLPEEHRERVIDTYVMLDRAFDTAWRTHFETCTSGKPGHLVLDCEDPRSPARQILRHTNNVRHYMAGYRWALVPGGRK